MEKVTPQEVQSLLQVPSPDWRDQIIYMIITDRFDDGDPSNSNQKAGEYNPKENAYFSGGDLKGITDNLDYIKGLGMTSLWITPPVANQWWDPIIQYSGYHGYWARDFKSVDEHLGTLEDYKLLSATLHKNDMYLIQDIVLNHVGNFFYYTGGWDKASPHLNFALNTKSTPGTAPTQYPFNLNDVRDKSIKTQNIYNWTPNIRDYNNPLQRLTYQMSSLDDLNTTNPVVRKALRESYNYWIKEVGVDGFRIDTIRYVEHDTLNDFLHNNEDKEALGAVEFAKTLGKDNFYVTGENLVNGKLFDPGVDKEVAEYQGTPEKPEILAPLNFTLTWDLRSVFQEGAPTSALTYRLDNIKKTFRNPDLLPNFVDSHDIDRFMKNANYGSMEQALGFVFTIPGIPVVLYGTEQEFTQSRASMFADGFSSEGKDHFNSETPGYRWIKALADLRKSNPVFSRGTMTVIQDSSSGAGIFVYTMEGQGKKAFVIFNSAGAPKLLNNLPTGLTTGWVLEPVLANLPQLRQNLIPGAGGKISFEIPAQGFGVYFPKEASAVPEAVSAQVKFTRLSPNQVVQGNLKLEGTSVGVNRIELLIDGSISTAVEAQIQPSGVWSAPLDAENLSSGPHTLALRGFYEGGWVATEPLDIKVDIPFIPVLTAADPVGDDKGPAGTYLYPTDATFKSQMDMESITLATAGKSLQVTIKSKGGITTSWNPQNGFDHVAFYVYLDIPGTTGGQKVLPKHNLPAPEGFEWDYFALAGGWANFLYSSKGASAINYGTPVKPAAILSSNKDAGTVTLTIPAESMGFPKTLSGTKVYIVTWDYDGIESANRALTPKAGAYIFGGGDGSKDPLVMDQSTVLLVP